MQVAEQAAKLQISFAIPAQKLQVFRSKIVAALRYVFLTTAFSPLDMKSMKRLDAAMFRFTKGALGPMQSRSVPNALVHEKIEKGGIGMPSLSLLHPYVSPAQDLCG